MSGITSNTGLISGIDTASIINQLIQIDSRPKLLAQSRLAQLQQQSAAFLDVNSKLSALRTAATKLRTNKIFSAATATSSDSNVLTATASAGATPGSYSFLVDRTVSSQQLLSRGFADRASGSPGITSLTFEPSRARLDSDTDLAQLNGGNGVSRGKIIVTDSAGTATTLDLSRVATVNDVLDAFNTHATLKVRASVQGGRLVLTDSAAGGGQVAVRSAAGYSTAESLGIAKTAAGATITGDVVYSIGDNTTIQSLNDGNGIRISNTAGLTNPDFTINTRDGSTYSVDIGDIYGQDGDKVVKTASAVTTVGQLKARILSQTQNKVSVEVTSDGRGLRFVDSTTGATTFSITDLKGAATDLGVGGTVPGATIDSRPLLAGLNSRLTSNLGGGAGISDGTISITTRDGASTNIDISGLVSVSDILSAFSTQTSGKVTAALDANGTSFILTDTTGGGGNFEISGAGATELGISVAPGGVASSRITSSRNNLRYVSESTLLSQLNNGLGVGTGTFEIQGPTADKKGSVIIDSSMRTIGDVISAINGKSLGVRARINDAGNGILLEKDPSVTAEAVKIRVTDTSGTAGRSLNLVGEGAELGQTNVIDGAFRRTLTFGATDTLDQIVSRINSSRAGVAASVVTDGASATPYRLRLTAAQAGTSGRFQVDFAGADPGLSTVTKGENSRVFFGADDPARSILVTRSSNTIENVVDGVRIDIKAASANPVTVNIARDNDSVITGVQEFVTSFNALSDRVFQLTRYNAETETRGTLLGDSTALNLRSELYSIINASASGVSGQYQRLAQVGISVGKNGALALDATKLRAALDTDPQAVADVFSSYVQNDRPSEVPVLNGVTGITVSNTSSATFSSLGVLERIGRLADRYLDSVSGVLTSKTKNLDDLVRVQNDRIANFDLRIATKREIYERQFAALETTLSKLQAQQSSLASIGG